MDVSEKLAKLKDGAEEIITVPELEDLLKSKSNPRAYWGFECSGYVHIGIGLITSRKMRHFIEAGIELIILLADWHSWINNKLGGDLEKIRTAGEYFKHVFKSLGVTGERVKFMWAYELVNTEGYWELAIKIAKKVSLRRVIRSLPIMGRREDSEIKEFAWLIYPIMQATDIFMLNVDIAAAGIDQRKVHMLARDVSKSIGFKKPIFIHTPILPSLDSPVPKDKEEIVFSKMSKSKPYTAIFVHDDEETVRRKIRKAYCPPKDVESNPMIYLFRYIIFPYMRDLNKNIVIKTRHGDLEFNDIDGLINSYSRGEIHPLDLKDAASEYLNEILEKPRRYFDQHSYVLDEMREIISEKT